MMMMIKKPMKWESRKVKLNDLEIDQIITALESSPHNLFDFFRYDKIIKKLEDRK